MFVADIITSQSPDVPASAYAPFIFTFRTNSFSLKDSWSESCDDIFGIGKKENVNQVTIDYINKMLPAETLNDCLSSTNSFYFDKESQLIYVHATIDANPVFGLVDYGNPFGVSTAGVEYIDDEEYLPLVVSYPEIETEDDATGQKQPTGIVASIGLTNIEEDDGNGKKVGVLDFMLNDNASCYGNDVYLYDYDKASNIKKLIGVTTVKSISVSLQKVTLSLKDERME